MNTQPIIRATEEQVRAISEPEGTATWNPIGHGRILDALAVVTKDRRVEIVNREYTLAANGKQLFGSWTIANGDTRRFMIGFRNSINTIFAVGFCSGLYVYVCENRVFSGDFKTFHRHTKGLTDDLLINMAAETWDSVGEEQAQLEAWHDNLLNYPVRENELEAMSFRAMRSGLIKTHRFGQYLECLDEEICITQEMSVHTFHAGVTRLIRQDNLFRVSEMTRTLTSFCNDEVGRIEALGNINRR